MPGIFIQASKENNIRNIATLSDSGVSTIAELVPDIIIQQVNRHSDDLQL
jgi:hypothetical protein